MSRYNQLLELIDKHKPSSLVEIGVWNGANAIRMINRALRYNTDVTYTGYDLFEDMTLALDEKEFNVKGHNSMRAVAAYIKAETGMVPNLIKGDTNQTLEHDTVADFVFIDGGHSIETIRYDTIKLSKSRVMVLDDYYTPDESGSSPDLSKYGCNHMLKWLEMRGGVDILPAKDPVKGGGYTQLVVVCQ